MSYKHIKENFINNFLNPYYRWTTGVTKVFIIDHIKNNCIFPAESINDNNTLRIDLGDNVVINIDIVWEQKEIPNQKSYYRLIKFN